MGNNSPGLLNWLLRTIQPCVKKISGYELWPYYLTGFIVLVSEIFTALMNSINSIIWWGRIDSDLLLIGCINALMVSLVATLIGIYFIKNTLNLQVVNNRLQHEIDESKQTENLLRNQTRELIALNSLSRKVSSSLSVEQISASGVSEILNLIRPDLAFLFLREGEKLMMPHIQALQTTSLHDSIPEHRVGECLCGIAVKEGKSIFSCNILKDPRCTREECKRWGIKSFAAIPLQITSKSIGVIGLASKTEQDFEVHSNFLETLAGHIAISLENARLFEALQVELAERKAAEEAKRESDKIFSLLIATMPDILVRTDLDGNILFVSEIAFQMTGYERSEIEGKHILMFVSPEDRDRMGENILLMYEKHLGPKEYYLVTKNGNKLLFEINADILRNENGVPCGILAVCRNINERKLAAEALLREYNFTDAILNNVPGIIYLYDDNNHLVRWNKELERITGYSIEELSGMNVMDWFMGGARDLAVINEGFNKTVEDGFGGAEAVVQKKDGEKIPMYFTVGSLTIDEKAYFVGIGIDITERKKLEQVLRDYQRQLEDIIDFLPDATFAINQAGMVIAWNRAIEEMSGINSKDILGKGAFDYAIPFYGTRRPILIDLIFQSNKDIEQKYNYFERHGELINAESKVQVKGENRVLWVIAGPLYDSAGNRIGAIESIRDITERKATENELQQLASIIKNIKEVVYLATFEGNVLFMNDAGIQLLGVHPDPIEQTNVQKIMPPHSQEIFRNQLLPNLLSNGIWEGELQYRNLKTGALTDMHAMATILFDQQTGRPLYFACVSLDITARKREHEEQEQLKLRLQQSHKMEAIGTLAGGIAHDFNNILSALIGYSELALGIIGSRDRVRYHLEQIHKASFRAKDLVKQILEFSRQSKQELIPISMWNILKEVSNFIRASLPSTIEMTVENLAVDDYILGDSTQLYQVVLNLCTNAEYAMRENGGCLTIRLQKMHVDSRTIHHYPELNEGEFLCLDIIDTGCGISKDILDRIFDPFFTTKAQGDGTGMGLSVVHGIVKNHGGIISVESTPGKGSTFTMLLPRFEMTSEKNEQLHLNLPMGKESILCVDDEELLVDMIEMMLSELGYNVVTKTNSLEALSTFHSDPGKFDVVITDQTMPKMTGLELSRALKQIRYDIPIILCTGFSHQITEQKAKEIGIQKLLYKPTTKIDLANAVRFVLEKKPNLE